MAKLPSEQDIGDLPDRLPRRMGVGSWQPGDLARGAESIARGGDQLGMALGRMAGEDKRLTNEAQLAQASSDAAVSHIQTSQAITNSTDPAQVAMLRENYQQNVEDAASKITDPDVAAKFRLTQAPEVARYQVGADTHATGLVKNAAVADFDNKTTGLINAAVSTDDEGQRTAALGAIKANGLSLVNRGILTPEEWNTRARQAQHDYASARVESEIARAKATGDTSRLQELGKLFEFNPGEWSAGGGGAPADAPAQNIAATYGDTIKAAAAKYGVSPSYLAKTAYIESRGNAGADNGFARGLMQFSDATAQKYGVKQGDAASSIDGAARYAVDNRAALTKVLGRPPTDAELYIAHQQGEGGGPKLFANPNARAGDLVGDKAIRDNGGDPNGTAKQFTDMWKAKFDATPDAIGGGGAAPQSRGIMAAGDSLAVGVAGAAGSDAKFAQVGIPPLPDPKNPKAPNVLDKIGALPDGGGKTLVISTGASNAAGLDPATYVPQQIAAAKAKGYDPVVLGVGPKFATLNPKLQAAAQAAGARFVPVDAGMVGPDGVHPIAQGYKAIAGLAGGAEAGGAPQRSPFLGLPPPGAVGANPHLVPPQSEWPVDARGVEHNPDGSLSYVMSEGNRVPVPGSRATGAPGAPAPSGTGTVLDALKANDRAEFGLKIQNAVDTIENAKGKADDQYTKAAVADIEQRVKTMSSGRPLTDDEWKTLEPYSKSPIPAVRLAYAQMDAIRNNLASYQGKSPAQVAADVAAKSAAYNEARAKYPNSEIVNTMGTILDASTKFLKTYQEEAAKDPIGRAVTAGMLPNGAVGIDPNDPNIAASWARRVVDAKTAAASLGVPPRFIRPAERAMLKDVARQGGEPMVDMAMHITQAAGPDAGQIFKEIGVDAPMFQKIGELAAGGGDPEAVKDIASVISAMGDKSAKGNLPRFTDKLLRTMDDPLKTAAARFGPDYAARTRGAANMLLSAMASRDGVDPEADPTLREWGGEVQQKFDRAYDLAAGATFGPDGTKYGGIVRRRPEGFWQDTTPTLVPNTMKADDFPKVINSILPTDLAGLSNPPRGANGASITPSQINRGLLEAMPDRDGLFRGKYAVFADGVRDDAHLMRDARGKPWALDLADPKLDAALRARNPDSYAAKPVTPTPSPGRYKEAPGMVALSGEAENQ